MYFVFNFYNYLVDIKFVRRDVDMMMDLQVTGSPITNSHVTDSRGTLSAQSELALNMISTMGRDAAISACWANEWLGVLEEIYALDRSLHGTTSRGQAA